MGQEYGERFHRARREEQRLEAALHALTPEEIPEEAEREELLKYIGYRKRSAVQMLIRQGNLPGLKAMKEKGWIEELYLSGDRELAAGLREVEIWAWFYPKDSREEDRKNLTASKEDLGLQVWNLTLKKLRIKLPGFAGAFAALKFQEKEGASYLEGDGFTVFYNRTELLDRFCREPDSIARDYMHLFLHQLYFHPVLAKGRREALWDLACDIAVEEMLDSWEIRELKKEGGNRRRLLLKEAGLPEKPLPAQRLYSALVSSGLSREEGEKLAEAFQVDGHKLWKEYRQEEMPEQNSREAGEKGGGTRQTETNRSLRFLRKWTRIRKEYALRMEEQHQRAGTAAGGGRQSLRLTGKGGYDYRNFLEQFMVSGEEVELDLDSFDYITYWYSREHYEGVVLLEPLEYKEIHRMREMVIAIDTSGSCSGRVVQQFLEETYRILSERENFFRKMEVHLIQCDSMIQEHAVIRSEEEFLDYMEHVTVKGLGGTDFRPVFDLVDRLIREKELRDLGGLLYFTDGDGVYPSKPPSYDTAFVFLNDAHEKHRIPDWGLRLNLHMDLPDET